jgi:hypothetical protein
MLSCYLSAICCRLLSLSPFVANCYIWWHVTTQLISGSLSRAVAQGKLSLIHGSYEYYHYMQDRIDDKVSRFNMRKTPGNAKTAAFSALGPAVFDEAMKAHGTLRKTHVIRTCSAGQKAPDVF